MARPIKRAKRAARSALAACANAVANATPSPIRRRLGPPLRYLGILLNDHLVIRLVFPNRHRLGTDAWRSAQPLPHQIAALPRLGIRSVVNLRGDHTSTTYHFEHEACRKHGITLVDFKLKSRDVPTTADVLAARDLILSIEHPVLFHCKSGADRAGLMSALYMHYRHGVPIAQAKSQLGLRFGHIRQANTGILDCFFESYLAYEKAHPGITFTQWVETIYDPDEVRRSFKSRGWANRIVDTILHRE